MSPMELIKKAFSVFKKKSAPPPKAADAPFEHDDNVVLVFGHSNAGKTVYFSVLYELLKGNADFKLSPLDNETAANLIENYNHAK
jgi:predicted Zn-dependent peptidase